MTTSLQLSALATGKGTLAVTRLGGQVYLFDFHAETKAWKLHQSRILALEGRLPADPVRLSDKVDIPQNICISTSRACELDSTILS